MRGERRREDEPFQAVSPPIARPVIFTLCAILLCGCGGGAPPVPPSDIVMIVLDTCRADRLGCYGYERARTPVIDGLADDGVLFEKCYTSVPITLPSHCSIFTSTYPFTHGVRDNGVHYLHDDALTLAEVLQSKGYFTAAVVGSYPLGKKYGLAQGFRIYDDNLPPTPMHRASELAFTYSERPATAVTDAALRLCRKVSGEPLFLWVHYFDPHAPYAPPPRFSGMFPDDPYDGEIAYVDSEIGRLLEALNGLRGERNRIVAVMSDHGEGLGEHGEKTHGDYVYDATLRIPLVIRGMGGIPAGRRAGALAREIDIMPTLLDAMDFEVPGSCRGSSLLPLLRDRESSVHSAPVFYAETYRPKIHYGWRELLSLREGAWKLIQGETPCLFNLEEDPGETLNRASAMEDRVRAMQDRLGEFLPDGLPPPRGVELPLNGEDLDRLKALGYVAEGDMLLGEGEPWEERDDSSPGGAREEILALLAEAKKMLGRGETSAALGNLDRVTEVDPRNKEAFFLKGALHGKMKEYDLAGEAFRKVLEIDPTDGRVVENLAYIAYRIGNYEEAVEGFERAAELLPHDEKAFEFLVDIYTRTDRHAEAFGVYERWMKIQPERADLYRDAGVILAYDLKDYPGAIAYWEKALALNPGDPQAAAIRQELSRLKAGMTRE